MENGEEFGYFDPNDVFLESHRLEIYPIKGVTCEIQVGGNVQYGLGKSRYEIFSIPKITEDLFIKNKDSQLDIEVGINFNLAKESNLFNYLSNHNLANKAAQLSKDWVSFDVDMTLPQRKVVELGKLLSRVFSLNFVLDMENTSFRADLINNAVDVLRTEIAVLFSSYSYQTAVAVVQDYEDNSQWYNA